MLLLIGLYQLVGMKGLEPSRLAAHAPKACVSTNSTTSPDTLTYYRGLADRQASRLALIVAITKGNRNNTPYKETIMSEPNTADTTKPTLTPSWSLVPKSFALLRQYFEQVTIIAVLPG